MKYQTVDAEEEALAPVEVPIMDAKKRWRPRLLHVAIFGSLFLVGYIGSQVHEELKAYNKYKAQETQLTENEVDPFSLIIATIIVEIIKVAFVALVIQAAVVATSLAAAVGLIAYISLNENNSGSRDEPIFKGLFDDLPFDDMKEGKWYAWCLEDHKDEFIKCTDRVGGEDDPKRCNKGNYKNWLGFGSPYECDLECGVWKKLWEYRYSEDHSSDYYYLQPNYCLKAKWTDQSFWSKKKDGWTMGTNVEAAKKHNIANADKYPAADEIFSSCEYGSDQWKKYLQIWNKVQSASERQKIESEINSCADCQSGSGGYVCLQQGYNAQKQEIEDLGYTCKGQLIQSKTCD